MSENVLVIDIETGSDGLLCIGFRHPGWKHASVSTSTLEVAHDLADPQLPKVGHSKYDPVWLRRHGVDVRGPYYNTKVMAALLNENQPLDLAFLVSKYLGKKMDKRLRRRSGRVLFLCDDGVEVPIEEAPRDQLFEYNRRDVDDEAALYEELKRRLKERMWWRRFLREEVPFTSVLIDMEVAGIPVDLEASEKVREELEVQASEHSSELLRSGGLPSSFNLNSGDQLAAYLFNRVVELQDKIHVGKWGAAALKECISGGHEDCEVSWRDDDWDPLPGDHVIDLLYPFGWETIGQEFVHGTWTVKGRGLAPTPKVPSEKRYSTSTPDLMMAHPTDSWVLDLINYRKLQKVLTTYLRKFPEVAVNGRIHGVFHQTGTKTGRLSSSDPNLQNIPVRGDLGPRVRGLFRGNFILGDYSQLEPRLMAHFSQDPVLLDVYRNNRDIYLVTAKAIFGHDVSKDSDERQMSKVVFLGSQYGAMDKKLGMILALNGFPLPRDRVKELREEFEGFLSTLYQWKEGVIEYVKEKGYVSTIGGRHRRLKHQFVEKWNWKQIGYGERQAVNAIIQGSAGDIVRRAMVACHYSYPEISLLLQVHDEMLWQHREGESHLLLPEIKATCEEEHGFDLDVPLLFDPKFVTDWSQKDTKIELPEEV